jgi:putative ABC transport system permease protein
MFGAHLRHSLRALRRHRAETFINAAGLALGLATFLLVALYISDEVGFDQFHERKERIYRLAGDYTGEGETRSYARIPPAVVPLLKRVVPGVEAGVRLQRASATLRVGEESFHEEQFFYTGADFFDIFSFPLSHGDPSKALSEPNSVVITESTARRYFGRTDALGETVVIADSIALTVTGVAEDVPVQSHLQFSVLASFATYEAMRSDFDLDEIWTWGTFYSYVLLRPDAERAVADLQIRQAIVDVRGANEDGSGFNARLQPIADIHLRSNLRQDMGSPGNPAYLFLFGIVGVCVLVIAAINFVNLATARGMARAKEIGVRKSVGADRTDLIAQFMTEAMATSVAGFLLAWGLATAALPAFNILAGKAFEMAALLSPWVLGGGLGLALVTGLVSGIYPAFYLSRFRPAEVLKTGRSNGIKRDVRLREALVVVQFAASIFLIGGTFIASNQVDHLREKEMGIAADQIVVIPFYWEAQVQERYGLLREELLKLPAVQAVTASGDVPGRMFTSMSIWAEGMQEDASLGANALVVDPDFAETYGLELAAGRDFSRDHPTDWDDAFMVNEAAARALGWEPEEAVGKEFRMNGSGHIVGVFRDFHYVGAQAAVEPIAMAMWPSWFGYVSVRLGASEAPASMAAIRDAWGRVIPDLPFEPFYLDDDFNRQYQAETRFGRVFGVLATLAIIIACLGLYGLAAFAAERRTKEVGIRKVLGAGLAGLTTLLSRRFAAMVAIGFLIATPITYLVMTEWLSSFASRAPFSASALLMAGLGALVIALATVSLHTLRLAMSDPVSSLRHE